MDGWMDEDGSTHMDEWADGRMDKGTDETMEGGMYDEITDRDGWMDDWNNRSWSVVGRPNTNMNMQRECKNLSGA